MLGKTWPATFGMLLWTSTAVLGGEPKAGPEPIHPDCVHHRQPRTCARVVQELTAELGRLNGAFSSPDAGQLAAFYHQDAVLFVGSSGRFFRGREEIKSGFFVPLAADISRAEIDVSAFHFQVISPDLVILYGSPTTVVNFKNGNVVTIPPLPQTLTWVRQGRDRSRPFLILTDHE